MKRIISLAVSLLIVLSCIFALAACDEVKSIASIDIASRDGLVDTYTITYTNGETSTFTVTNGKDGEDGIGGIQGIQGTPGADGHTPIITIVGGFWYVDGENTGVQAEGIKGDVGNGVSDISLTSREENVDTYTITYTDGSVTTFTVTNGKDGAQGIQGIQGVPGKDGKTPVITIVEGIWHVDGVSTHQSAQGVKGDTGNGISDISLTAQNGNVDTYTITFTDGNTTTFTVTNGKDGAQGIQGIQGIPGKDGKTPVITIVEGIWHVDGVSTHQAAQGIKGDTGNGISDISFTSSEENVDTYTITFTNGGTTTFTVTNGKDGAQGIQGIQGIPGKDGKTPVITIVEGIWHVDGVSTHQSAQGVKGDTGNGISDISLTAQIGNVDTYTITYTDGSFTTFTVTNGKDGAQGIQGIPGKDGHTPVITIIEGEWYVDGVSTGVLASVKGDDGNGISSIFLSSSEGLVDTYTVIYTNGGTTTFTVTNGAQGIQGIQGIPGKDGHTPVITIVDGFWCVDGENTHQWAIGVKGDVGNGISDISLTAQIGNVDTYTITFTDGNTTTFTVTNGKDGESVRLGENGNWWIGSTDTGVKAKGDYELMYNSAAVSVDWYDESESVYYINDIYDFNGIAYLVNEEDISFEGKTILLNADLDFEGVRINTIGDFRNSFRGTFDGGNHSLFGIKWDERYGVLCEDPDRGYNDEQLRVYILGLFYYNYGTIKNIEIRGFDIDLLTYDAFINAHTDACSLLAVNNYGQICGIRAYGSSRIVADGTDDSSGSVPLVKYNVGTVSDCEIVMDTELAVTTRVKIATVVSQNDGIVKDCDVSGSVLLKIVDGAELSVGGVVLISTRGSSIIGCKSSVNVVIDGGVNNAFIGGIAAEVNYGTVDDCMFDGVVRVNAENDKSYSWNVAGIAARMLNNSEYARSEVINCTVSGEFFINIKDSVFNTDYMIVTVGGIIADAKFNGTVGNCTFNGKILANVESESDLSYVYLGGIFGDNDKGIHTLENNDYTTTVTDCVNAGQIYLAGDFHFGFVGGIAGRTYLSSYVDSSLMNTAINKITYDSCRFEGEIKASNDRQYGLLLGGIAARAGSVTLKDCSVSGRVEVTSLVDICYGEVVADAGYSVFLDGGKTKTRVENCTYGNTVRAGSSEYNLKNIMGISDSTEFVMPITAEQLLGKENYALLSGGEREFYIQLFTWATEISNHEYAYEYEKLYGVFSGGFYGMIVLEPYGIDPDRAVDIYNLVLFDFPELVRLTPTGAAISTDGKQFAFSLSERYDGSAHSEADDIASLDAIVESLLSNTVGMSDYEKLEYAFELLLSASEYAFDGEGNPIGNDNTYTLLGALIDGYAVCEGYAMAFNFLCDALGISSYVIVSEELDHAWNIVELDGAWYFVDATWTDTEGDIYFLLGSVEFEQSHGAFDELLEYPELSEDYYGKPVEMFYVTFMVNGEEYASVPVESGSLVTVPEAPQIEGYTFNGWITLSEGKPFDFNEPITSSVTLVAKMRAV